MDPQYPRSARPSAPCGHGSDFGGHLPVPLARDATGRFLAGNGGGGRRRGSRNKLTETLLSAVADDFAEHGAEALAKLRSTDPASYLRIVASFVPRELIMQREREPDFGDMSHEEIVDFIERAERHQLVKKALDAAGDA